MKPRYILILAFASLVSCTKLDQKLQDSFTVPGGSNAGVDALLTGAYNSMNGLMHGQERIFSLQETTTDEALIPVRGGDWDDNGVWRVLHAHTWTTIHTQFKNTFNELGALESAAMVWRLGDESGLGYRLFTASFPASPVAENAAR